MSSPLGMGGVPTVTVVIPSKDRPELVRRAMLTALEQEHVDLEVIVVDDGSRVPVVAASQDERLQIIRHDQAQGVAAARNRGLRDARGRYVAFLDDDDLWAPSKLAAQLAEMERTGARWSYTGTVVLNEQLHERWRAMPNPGYRTIKELRDTNAVGSPSSVVAETDLVREAGGFDGRFSTFADWDLWLRMGDAALPIAVQEFLTGYVTHDGSMHRQALREVVGELRALRTVHAHRGRLARFDLWQWISHGQRDSGRPYRAAAISVGLGVRWGRPDEVLRAAKMVYRGVRPREHSSPAKDDWVRRWQRPVRLP